VGEFLVFAAALLPHPAAVLSAFAIYQLTNATCYQPPGGLRVAVGSRIGNSLGAGEPDAAQRSWLCGVGLVTLWIGVPALLLGVCTRAWAHIFTDDEQVVALLHTMVPWLILYVSLDALLAINAGAFTGCGRQGLGGRLALFSYCAIGLPAALTLAFRTPLQAVGIAMGHTLGKLAMTLATGYVVATTDWAAQSAAAKKRIEEQHADKAEASGAELRAAPPQDSVSEEERQSSGLAAVAAQAEDEPPVWVAPARRPSHTG
jgi:MATE family multidrug resistance protein